MCIAKFRDLIYQRWKLISKILNRWIFKLTIVSNMSDELFKWGACFWVFLNVFKRFKLHVIGDKSRHDISILPEDHVEEEVSFGLIFKTTTLE